MRLGGRESTARATRQFPWPLKILIAAPIWFPIGQRLWQRIARSLR
jgi:hypothetical protein